MTRSKPQSEADAYLKLRLDLAKREFAFRIGKPLLAFAIKSVPKQWIKDTKHNKIYGHSFSLKSINKASISIAGSVRWEQRESIPLSDRTWKRGEINCGGVVHVVLSVSKNHCITIDNPPVVASTGCTSSGIGVEQIYDRLGEVLTFLASGGKETYGLLDVVAAYGTMWYDIAKALYNEPLEVGRPIDLRELKRRSSILDAVLQIGNEEDDCYLSQVDYTREGLWFILSFSKRIARLIEFTVTGSKDAKYHWDASNIYGYIKNARSILEGGKADPHRGRVNWVSTQPFDVVLQRIGTNCQRMKDQVPGISSRRIGALCYAYARNSARIALGKDVESVKTYEAWALAQPLETVKKKVMEHVETVHSWHPG